MDILTLKSKAKLGCNMCDKCCIYRGDIKLTPVNVCRISRFLNISNEDFIKEYTDKLEGRPLERVLKTRGPLRECILYDKSIHGCSIHNIKPMQCTMFPLVPENLKRDYFYNSEQCVLENAKEITVNKWLNGNNNNYKKNKEICMKWIEFLEIVQPKIIDFNKEKIEELHKILYYGYDMKLVSLKKQMYKKMKTVLEKL